MKTASKEQDTTRARPNDAARQAAAEWVPVASLKPWAKNPRKNEAAVPKVLASIKRFGWASPILARLEDGEVVAGHTRLKAHEALTHEYEAAKASGKRVSWHADAVRSVEAQEVPVRFGDWSAREAHLLALADNKLNEIAEWDTPVMMETLGGYDFADADLAGWSADDLAKMADGFAADEDGAGFGGVPDGDREPFRQMTFTLHDDQAATVEAALSAAMKQGPFDGPNANSNGNALARVCEAFRG